MTDHNNVLSFRTHILTGWRLLQPFTLNSTNSLLELELLYDRWLTANHFVFTVLLVTSWHGLHRKQRPSVAVSYCCSADMHACEAFTQLRQLCICLSRCRCPTTGLNASTCHILCTMYIIFDIVCVIISAFSM
jgi:hypothetical protein